MAFINTVKIRLAIKRVVYIYIGKVLLCKIQSENPKRILLKANIGFDFKIYIY